MLRRVFALILAVTCAFAPAASAFELAASTGDSCCCGTKCPCPVTDCAPPPVARTAPAPASATVEQRALAAKPRARIAAKTFLAFLSAPPAEPALTVRIRATHADALAPADGAALYEAHCSFLI